MSDKNKKTLTINPNFGKKISSNYTGNNKKKSFNIEKKKSFRPGGFKKNDFLGKNTKFVRQSGNSGSTNIKHLLINYSVNNDIINNNLFSSIGQ